MNRHLYHDKNGRLIAAICINGKQKLKRVKDKAQAQQWFLAMETGNTKAITLRITPPLIQCIFFCRTYFMPSS